MPASIATTDHRPWPLPDRPWAGAMRWHDLLFAHWPVRQEVLRPYIPAPLAIDTYDGWAWLGVVPFRMSAVRPRMVPPVLGLRFPELNVRTYVRSRGREGVWFFSLDASSRLAVRVARRLYGLAYYDAEMRCSREGEVVTYESRRTDADAPPAVLTARYRPTGAPFRAEPGSLDHFLTERYALYSLDRQGRVRFGDIHHAPWELQPAEAEFDVNTMAAQLRTALPERGPILHYARYQEVVAWRLLRLADVNRQQQRTRIPPPARQPSSAPQAVAAAQPHA
jgi:uncharacterized protein